MKRQTRLRLRKISNLMNCFLAGILFGFIGIICVINEETLLRTILLWIIAAMCFMSTAFFAFLTCCVFKMKPEDFDDDSV